MSKEKVWRDGVIVTATGEVLARPKMTFQEFRETQIGTSAELDCPSPGYMKARISAVQICEYECAVGLYFNHDILMKVSIVITQSTADRYSLVIGYAAPPDGALVHFLQEWVQREIGPHTLPAQFSWGRIGQIYDTKSNLARILFNYSLGSDS